MHTFHDNYRDCLKIRIDSQRSNVIPTRTIIPTTVVVVLVTGGCAGGGGSKYINFMSHKNTTPRRTHPRGECAAGNRTLEKRNYNRAIIRTFRGTPATHFSMYNIFCNSPPTIR